jgi:hypothetical protein
VQGGDDVANDPVGVELLDSATSDTEAIHRLSFLDGLHEGFQSTLIFVRFHTLLSWRQPVNDDACFASPYE